MTKNPPVPQSPSPKAVKLLILGAGWTSQFLLPMLAQERISFAATTTTGRSGTLKFIFDPASSDPAPYLILPDAETVLITFPLRGVGQSAHLREMYLRTHRNVAEEGSSRMVKFMQLGSTGIFQIPGQTCWVTRHSQYDKTDDRAVAEDELLAAGGCVLNLAGLWGRERRPKEWVGRVAGTKQALAGKKSLHLIHGADVARAIIAVVKDFSAGERWMLTDLMVYDWWALILKWGEGEDGREPIPQLGWLQELIMETDTKGLPRANEELGRCYDSREFWNRFGLMPLKAGL